MTARVRGLSLVEATSMLRMSSGSFIFWGFLRANFLVLNVPGAEEATEDDEFAEMVGVVVGDEEGFAEKVLALAPAERFEEVGLWVFDECDEGFEVGVDEFDGAVPGVVGGWFGRLRPVVLRPAHGVVAAGGWRGEVEDVALGDAEMLEKLPGGVGEFGRDGAAEVGGKILDYVRRRWRGPGRRGGGRSTVGVRAHVRR